MIVKEYRNIFGFLVRVLRKICSGLVLDHDLLFFKNIFKSNFLSENSIFQKTWDTFINLACKHAINHWNENVLAYTEEIEWSWCIIWLRTFLYVWIFYFYFLILFHKLYRIVLGTSWYTSMFKNAFCRIFFYQLNSSMRRSTLATSCTLLNQYSWIPLFIEMMFHFI